MQIWKPALCPMSTPDQVGAHLKIGSGPDNHTKSGEDLKTRSGPDKAQMPKPDRAKMSESGLKVWSRSGMKRLPVDARSHLDIFARFDSDLDQIEVAIGGKGRGGDEKSEIKINIRTCSNRITLVRQGTWKN